MSKKKEYWTVTNDDGGYTCERADVLYEMNEMQPGDTITLEKREMTEKEFNELPEL